MQNCSKKLGAPRKIDVKQTKRVRSTMEMVAYEKSFASHEKSQYWSSKNGEIKPEHVYKSTHRKYWFDCPTCPHTFEQALNHITRGRWCSYCCIPTQKLCDDDECETCFEKSLASHEKHRYWSNKNVDIFPRQVIKSSHKKYWFDCGKCTHSFELALVDIMRNLFCPFCSNHQLCNDTDCNTCHQKSFASHDKSQYWSNKNGDIVPRQLSKQSNKKCWFDCTNCHHHFQSALNHISNVQNPRWCPYCCIPTQKLCDDTSCNRCFENSFASHDKSQYWCLKNCVLLPRQVHKCSNKKHWFHCQKCSHSFETAPNTIVQGNHWCPYCVNQALCDDVNCNYCFEKSFASHHKSEYWSSKNLDTTPRQIFTGTDKKYWFDCDTCTHSFETTLNHITRQNSWCPHCVNKKLCDDVNCNHCLEKSFASHHKSEY